MKFDIVKTLKLDYFGEGWGECYLNFYPITLGEAKELMNVKESDTLGQVNRGMEILKSKFKDGKMLSDGKLVDVKANDFDEFPMTLISECLSLLNEEKKIPN